MKSDYLPVLLVMCCNVFPPTHHEVHWMAGHGHSIHELR